MKKNVNVIKTNKKTILISLVSFILGLIFGITITYFCIPAKIATATEPEPTTSLETSFDHRFVTINEFLKLRAILDKHMETYPWVYVELDQGYLNAATYIAKTVYGEACGLNTTEQAGVIWCILNRVDARASYTANDIIAVVTAPSQFHGYSAYNPVNDTIYNLTIDVMKRWLAEKNGYTNVGRVLPKEYLYFYGDGRHNYFRTSWRGGTTWNWGLESPYV